MTDRNLLDLARKAGFRVGSYEMLDLPPRSFISSLADECQIELGKLVELVRGQALEEAEAICQARVAGWDEVITDTGDTAGWMRVAAKNEARALAAAIAELKGQK